MERVLHKQWKANPQTRCINSSLGIPISQSTFHIFPQYCDTMGKNKASEEEALEKKRLFLEVLEYLDANQLPHESARHLPRMRAQFPTATREEITPEQRE